MASDSKGVAEAFSAYGRDRELDVLFFITLLSNIQHSGNCLSTSSQSARLTTSLRELVANSCLVDGALSRFFMATRICFITTLPKPICLSACLRLTRSLQRYLLTTQTACVYKYVFAFLPCCGAFVNLIDGLPRPTRLRVQLLLQEPLLGRLDSLILRILHVFDEDPSSRMRATVMKAVSELVQADASIMLMPVRALL